MEYDNENQRPFRSERHDRFWTGLVLIIVGAFLFMRKTGVELPDWLFSWEMILILAGIVTGFKHRFQNFSWLIMIAVGCFFLADDMMIEWNMKPYFWPVFIMAMGLLFILRPKKKWYREREEWRNCRSNRRPPVSDTAASSDEDVIDSTSIFGGVKKMITSKNFKGGEIICFMGGAEYNLGQADITGPISIEIIQAFGGIKLIVPPHWEIRSESIAIFAGIEDKRPPQPGFFDPNKVLTIKGTTIFGGIEIKSY